MFNKLKQFKDLRDQAKTMQNALATEKVTAEKQGVTIEMNGNMEVLSIVISQDLPKEQLASICRDVFNDAVKKMQEMGGLSNLGL
jgi:DNA-binding protein YbaB